MNSDPVIALLTAAGKKLWIPKNILGLMESLVADPEKKFGRHRTEVLRDGLIALRDYQNQREVIRLSRQAEDAQAALSRSPEATASTMDPKVLAQIDHHMQAAVKLAGSGFAWGGDLMVFLMGRARTSAPSRKPRRRRKEGV